TPPTCAASRRSAESAPSPASRSRPWRRSTRSCCGSSARAACWPRSFAVELLGSLGYALEGLSMGAAAGLAVAGARGLAGLYLLRPRRRRVVVAFAPLWVPLAGERRAERWARRLRRWLSLALQLAVFALLLVAAADPQRTVAGGAGRTVVVLVDHS